MTFTINGQNREFPNLAPGATLDHLIDALALKGDRVAVEHNGDIVSRPAWPTTSVADGDRFEIVHFVGGGAGPLPSDSN
jgi:sulfur carrier protein